MATRTEKDTLGTVEVPQEAYYGAQTARAVANFPISGLPPHPDFVWGVLVIKKCAALANMSTGRLRVEVGEAIVQAADEALQGQLDAHFVVDPFQAGAGTSHNMNVNEVLANRAAEILGGSRGDYLLVHPNDHVNMAQSTNDVIPTAIRLASLRMLNGLLPQLAALREAFRAKGDEFDRILTSGRTHMQDAVPIRLGQQFAAFAVAVDRSMQGLDATSVLLNEVGLGGTAVGTGLSAEPEYIDRVIPLLIHETGFPLYPAEDLVEATWNMDPFVALAAALKRLAVTLAKICEDLRLLSSGPRTGLNEINLPAVQPGSSIMPGKVNPVITEMTSMVCFQVMGAETAVSVAAQAGRLQLNVMMPLIAWNLLFSMQILTSAVERLASSCVEGITANEGRCGRFLEESVGLATVLAPSIGYAAAAEVAKESVRTGRSIREIILARQLLSEQEMASIL
ncbi:MAG TPA: aspartate ammonia-lyase, partial [Verrucomicrobiae bacterium]|nr:aspartate ammonia-lyase [Verrucomicrobiae bacterium]